MFSKLSENLLLGVPKSLRPRKLAKNKLPTMELYRRLFPNLVVSVAVWIHSCSDKFSRLFALSPQDKLIPVGSVQYLSWNGDKANGYNFTRCESGRRFRSAFLQTAAL